MFELLASRLPATLAPPPATPTATPTPHQQDIAHAKQRFDEKAAFDSAVEAAVARINANASHAAHGAAQERPCAEDKDNAQYLEHENNGLRIQAETKPDYTVAARPGEFPESGQPTAVVVAAAEPETGGCVLRARDGHDRRRGDIRRSAPGPLHLEVDRG